MLGFLIFPLMLGFIAIAPEMFELLLGQKWMPTVPYFEILALSGLFYPLAIVAYNVLKTKSDGRIILRLEVIKRVIMTAVLVYTIPRGVESVAWGMTAMAAIEFLLNTASAMRYMSIGLMQLIRAIRPSLLLASSMFAALFTLNPYLKDTHLALHLTIDFVVAATIYLLLAWCFKVRALNEGISLLKGLLSRK